MKTNKRAAVFTGLIALVAVVAITAFAQERERQGERARPEGGFGRGGEGGGFPGGGGFGQPGGQGGRPMGGMPGGGTAIAATQQYVYVVQGNQLFQFKAEGLTLAKRVELEGNRPQFGPGGPGGEGAGRRPGGDEAGRRPEGQRPPGGDRDRDK